MARPATKQDLEFLAKENYQKLLSLIETLPEEQREDSFPEGTMNRNIRDVIGHLYHWHLLFLNWYEVGMRGEKPKIPKEGYTFSDTPKLNREIWEQCQKVSLAEIVSLDRYDLTRLLLSFIDVKPLRLGFKTNSQINKKK